MTNTENKTKSILSALDAIDPAGLTYEEWLHVGMALHTEGEDCAAWDSWSRSDSGRYHTGDCEAKWKTFRGSAAPITGGTIIKMAKDRGWTPSPETCQSFAPRKLQGNPDQLITYLETLFEPGDFVGYVTTDAFQNEGGRWSPRKGVYNRTAGELIEALKANRNNMSAAIGRWHPEAGAWIRFNPVDGKGVKNDNVTRFKYALVESDDIPIAEQEEKYKKLQLPIACLVNSGGKSLHAIVHIDAKDSNEYRRRVDYLYDYLEKNGLPVDKQNRNPSRLSRMPGVTRNGKLQSLAATDIGCKSWDEWVDTVEAESDDLPEPQTYTPSMYFNPPPLADPLISGILRQGHKMLISGSSKAGKSFLLLELAIAITEGTKWLSFDCKKGNVLYINLEIDPNSCINRINDIYKALGMVPGNGKELAVWNLRAKSQPLDELVPKILRRMRGKEYSAVIIDPIYKVIMGDENNASDMAKFCNQFDIICAETGSSVIYSHHHSKGFQGGKRAMDRASGSGVFARDPDAQIDMIQLELTEDIRNNVRDDGATAWRLESSLREFENFKPVNFWFKYPIHVVDNSSELEECRSEGSIKTARAKNHRATSLDERRNSVMTSYRVCSAVRMPVTIADMAEQSGVTERCMRDRIKGLSDYFWVKNGIVGEVSQQKTENVPETEN